MKWLCIISGALLVLGIPSGLSYSYYIFLRWFVFLASLTVAFKFYRVKITAWTLIFTGVAFLFNPLFPIYLTKTNWIAIDLISAILFLLAGFSVKKPK